eukprot:m.273415 g.273415  ORF g.273415 m.273415 type:complete len:84 (+) comp22850_c0_seq15:377-628(+)
MADERIPEQIVVSGAGKTQCNGTYHLQAEKFQGKHQWFKDNNMDSGQIYWDRSDRAGEYPERRRKRAWGQSDQMWRTREMCCG